MTRHTIIAPALALVVGLAAWLPATATASGPLLSGYGGPGDGSQAIIGSALLGGGSSRGGGSGGGTSTGSEVTGAGAAASRGGGARAAGAGGVSGSNTTHGSSRQSRAGGSATHPGAAGANPQTPTLRGGETAADATVPDWFSGTDILALALAAGALLLVGLATARIARTQRH